MGSHLPTSRRRLSSTSRRCCSCARCAPCVSPRRPAALHEPLAQLDSSSRAALAPRGSRRGRTDAAPRPSPPHPPGRVLHGRAPEPGRPGRAVPRQWHAAAGRRGVLAGRRAAVCRRVGHRCHLLGQPEVPECAARRSAALPVRPGGEEAQVPQDQGGQAAWPWRRQRSLARRPQRVQFIRAAGCTWRHLRSHSTRARPASWPNSWPRPGGTHPSPPLLTAGPQLLPGPQPGGRLLGLVWLALLPPHRCAGARLPSPSAGPGCRALLPQNRKMKKRRAASPRSTRAARLCLIAPRGFLGLQA